MIVRALQSAALAIRRPGLRARAALPNIEAVEHRAWLEGFWNALPVGLIVGFALAIVIFKR
jgi:hypothetical protein